MVAYSPNLSSLREIVSTYNGTMSTFPPDIRVPYAEECLNEISKLTNAVLLELEDDNGYEHTYLLSFPSRDELDKFLEVLSEVAHLKAVLEASLSGEKQEIFLPRWMSHIVTRYRGGARYSMVEKWMVVQEPSPS